jgi:hypothetical protein
MSTYLCSAKIQLLVIIVSFPQLTGAKRAKDQGRHYSSSDEVDPYSSQSMADGAALPSISKPPFLRVIPLPSIIASPHSQMRGLLQEPWTRSRIIYIVACKTTIPSSRCLHYWIHRFGARISLLDRH